MVGPIASGTERRPATRAQPSRFPSHDSPQSTARRSSPDRRPSAPTTGIRKYSVNSAERPTTTKKKLTGKTRPPRARPPYSPRRGAAPRTTPSTSMAPSAPSDTSMPPTKPVSSMSGRLRSSRSCPTPAARPAMCSGSWARISSGRSGGEGWSRPSLKVGARSAPAPPGGGPIRHRLRNRAGHGRVRCPLRDHRGPTPVARSPAPERRAHGRDRPSRGSPPGLLLHGTARLRLHGPAAGLVDHAPDLQLPAVEPVHNRAQQGELGPEVQPGGEQQEEGEGGAVGVEAVAEPDVERPEEGQHLHQHPGQHRAPPELGKAEAPVGHVPIDHQRERDPDRRPHHRAGEGKPLDQAGGGVGPDGEEDDQHEDHGHGERH